MKSKLFAIVFGILPSVTDAAVTLVSTSSDALGESQAVFSMEFEIETDADLYVSYVQPLSSTISGPGIPVTEINFLVDGEPYSSELVLIEAGSSASVKANWFVQTEVNGYFMVKVESFDYHFLSPNAPLTHYLLNHQSGFYFTEVNIPEPTTFTLSLCALGLGLIRRR